MRGRRTILTPGLVVLFLLGFFFGSALALEKYRVKSGDSLAKIAKKHGVTPQSLRNANHLQSDALKVRQVLIIPDHRTHKKKKVVRAERKLPADREIYIAKRGDTVNSVADAYGLSGRELKKMNRLRSMKLKKGQKLIVPKEEQPDDSLAELGDADDAESLQKGENGEDKHVLMSTLGKWKSADERKLFVRITKTFLGVPYRLGGSTMKGIDCSAFVKRVYEIFDIQLPRTAREQSMIGQWVAKDELQEGDLVFFKTRSRRVTGHVGIYIGNSEFVHASGKNRGTKLDKLDSDYYSRRFVRGVRVMELDRELAAKAM